MADNSLALQLNKNTTSIETHFPNDVVFGSTLGRNLYKLPISGKYVVSQEVAYSPSKISKYLYGVETYDWIILFINGVTQNDLRIGCVLDIPSVTSINNYLSL